MTVLEPKRPTRKRHASHPAHDYARCVVTGKRPACLTVRQACQRHLDDLEEGRFTFDPQRASHPVRFISKFRHYKGQWAGRPFEVEPWQAFILASLFGWLRPDGLRRYRYAFIEVPRKNGKTLLAAGIGIYMLTADGEGGPEIHSAATKEDQAKILWRDAKTMIQKCGDAEFSGQFDIKKNPAVIELPENSGRFTPLSSDDKTGDGLNPHCVLVDELHAWRDPALWNVLNSALGARSQPLFFQITTAGYVTEGICRQQERLVRSMLNRTFENDSYFGFIAAADEGDAVDDERTWRKANPNYGVSVLVDGMRDSYNIAVTDPQLMVDFKVKKLNIWTTAAKAWLNMEEWKECFQEFDTAELEGMTCYGGLDLAQVRDLSALALLFPPQDGLEQWTALLKFWCPADNIPERSRRDRVPYQTWCERGFIEATPGNVTDYNWIQTRLIELAAQYDFQGVAYDRTFAGQIVQNLTDEGIEMVQHGQGFLGMSSPTKEFERMVAGRELNHLGNPVLQWMAENVVVAMDSHANIKPDKRKSEEKIDGISALIMALGLALVKEDDGAGLFEVW